MFFLFQGLPSSSPQPLQDPRKPVGPPKERYEKQTMPQDPKAIPGEVIIMYKGDFLPSEKDSEQREEVLASLAKSLTKQFKAETIAIYPESGWVRLKLPPNVEIGSVADILKEDNRVEDVLPNYEIRLHSHTPPPPADWLWNTHFSDLYSEPFPQYPYLWGLAKIGMQQGWTLGDTAGGGVLIAVLDTGIDFEHPDLMDNYHGGKTFCGAKKSPMDTDGHGTYVAAIIGARGGNGTNPDVHFFVGVDRTARLLAIKIDCADGPTMPDAIEGVKYAVRHHAGIINGSWEGPKLAKTHVYVKRLEDAIKAGKDTTLYVASAGNDGIDLNNCPAARIWPQMFMLDNLENLIVVAATNPDDSLWSRKAPTGPDPCQPSNNPDASNYGDSIVNLAAPGMTIWSTEPRSQFDTTSDPIKNFVLVKSSTSGAAPFVTGCAALVQSRQQSRHPGSAYSPSELKSILTSSGTSVDALNSKVANAKRLDCFQALQHVN
jgi:subtilisin family serine protease